MYTIVNESKYLLVFGVPRINLHREVKQLLAKYGRITSVQKITDKLIKNETGKFNEIVSNNRGQLALCNLVLLYLQLKLNNLPIAIRLNMKKCTVHDGPKHLSTAKISTEVN